MSKLYYITPYDDENILYFSDELVKLGCSPEQALKIHYSLYNHIRYLCRLANKVNHYEIPIGDIIDQLSDDDSIMHRIRGKALKLELPDP